MSRAGERAGSPGPEERATTPLFEDLVASLSPSRAEARLVTHLVDELGAARAAVFALDAHDGRLHGYATGGGAGSHAVAVTGDPVAGGALAEALGRLEVLRVEGEAARALPGPLAGSTEALLVAMGQPSSPRGPATCPRVDCPERCRRPGICGAGAVTGTGWTRDRLTCGLLPVVGLLVVARGDGEPAFADDLTARLDPLADQVTPLFESFRLKESLSDAEFFRQDLLDSMTEAILATNLRGDVLLANRAATDLLRLPRDEIVGRAVEEVFLERGQTTSSAAEALRGARLLRAERRLRRHDGTDLPISVTTSPITTREWGVRGILLSFVDLTPIKEMEEEIRRLDRLATLGRFTTAVAHEVRNPLGGIVAGVQYLRSILADRPDADEHLGFLERETARLDRIVDDLGRTMRFRTPHPVATDLALLLDEVGVALRPLTGTAEVTVTHELAAGPALIDPDQVQQVLLNLVRNAVEASPRGGAVTVRTETIRDGARRRVRIEIEDQGEGVRDAIRERIFEPFTSTKTEGTGLGLFISHGIVTRHGGELQITDADGGGARVVVLLPAADAEESRR